MEGLFILLLLASLTALVAGLIKPSLFARIKLPTRKLVGLVFGGLLLISFVGIGITTEPLSKQGSLDTEEPSTELERRLREKEADLLKKDLQRPPQQTEVPPPETITAQEVIFDIPKLFGKSLPQLKSIIGQPAREKPNVYDAGGWAEWDKAELTLSVNYDENKKLIDTDIGCAMGILPSKLNVYWDEQKLRQAGNISGSGYPFRVVLHQNKEGVLYSIDICYK